MRIGVHNFVTNRETPSVFTNDVFQISPSRVAATITRFAVNSTVGISGIFEIAGGMGLRYRDNDFGATLATHGVGGYPYPLVPLIGPSNLRDLSGKFADFFLNPLRYFALPGGFVTPVADTGLHELVKRSESAGQLVDLTATASDPYAAERSMARARHKAELGLIDAPGQ